MKRRRLVWAALVLAGFAGLVAAVGLAALLWPAEPPPPPCTEGERLRYTVSFIGVEAGTLDLAVAGEGAPGAPECFVVEMRIASTNKLLEHVFKIRESWRSKIDREGIFSRGYELSRLHGNTSLADEQSHDYAAGISKWRRREGEGEWKGEVPLAGRVQDPVSWLYYCRGRIVKAERELRFVLVERNRVRDAELLVTGEEDVDLGPLGRVRAFRASGSVGLGGLGGEQSKEPGVDQEASVMWFEVATGILVKARIALKYGTLELALREIENAPPLGRGP